MNKLSIAIPTSDLDGKTYFFKRCLDSLWNQSLQDFEIIVTDNSEDDEIEKLCEWYKTGIKYYKNPIKGMAQNTNEAIRRSTGELIKVLYMDDFMAHDEALQEIVKHFKGEWMVSGCTHTADGIGRYNAHFPKYTEGIQLGNNTIGSPSVLTIKNKEPLLFDEELTWLLDCDLYKRYYDKYGEPTILSDLNVVMGLHEGQATYTMGDDRKLQEEEYIRTKYE